MGDALFKNCDLSLVPCTVRPLRQEDLLSASLYLCQYMKYLSCTQYLIVSMSCTSFFPGLAGSLRWYDRSPSFCEVSNGADDLDCFPVIAAVVAPWLILTMGLLNSTCERRFHRA